MSDSVDLHIDEMVFTGFEWLDAADLKAFVEQELMRLFTERGMPRALDNIDSRAVPNLEMNIPLGEAGIEVVGSRLAQALYERVGG